MAAKTSKLHSRPIRLPRISMAGVSAPAEFLTRAAELEAKGEPPAQRCAAFLAAYYGVDVAGQQVDVSLRTIVTEDRLALVLVAGVPHAIVDIGLRILARARPAGCLELPGKLPNELPGNLRGLEISPAISRAIFPAILDLWPPTGPHPFSPRVPHLVADPFNSRPPTPND